MPKLAYIKNFASKKGKNIQIDVQISIYGEIRHREQEKLIKSMSNIYNRQNYSIDMNFVHSQKAEITWISAFHYRNLSVVKKGD